MTGKLRFRLCSVLSVETSEGTLTGRDLGSRKGRTLLALLASERGQLVPLDRITEALWPETAPADPAANVATLVSRARRLLGPGVLTGSGAAYGLLTAACVTDLDEAGSLLVEAAAGLSADERSLAAVAARRALHLLGATPALPEEPETDWVLRVRQHSEELRRESRHLLSSAVLATDPREAAAVAVEAVAVDAYDERAVRDLIRAQVAGGTVAAALTTYDALATRLRDDLGIDPSAETAELHLAVLREERLPADSAKPAHRQGRPTLVGRETELAMIDRSWVQACAGTGGLVLVEGVGGIGKTRLLDATSDLAGSTGGLALRGRCHPSERSLFLQPYVDALRPVLLGLGGAELAALLREHTGPWASLLPELVELVEVVPEPPAAPAIERRRVYDAVAAVLRRLARQRPVLLCLDDLQDGGSASVDLLGYLAGRLTGHPVLLVGAVRQEDQQTVDRLSDRATRVPLHGLPSAAVRALASAAGLGDQADELMARTSGHALSVVECLRALGTGEPGVPESLAAAVLTRVDRLDPQSRDVLQGASVLHGLLDPRLLADLVGLEELAAVRHCEALALAGLLERDGALYEFANDLAQECVRVSLPPALAAAFHRRAADLLSDQPESMATHAFEAGERGRAAQGWLLAGQAAMTRSAVEDATGLYDQALAAAEEPSLRARVLLARAVAHEASTAWETGLADIEEALALARAGSDRRLEMHALRALGGDIPVALHLSMADVGRHLGAGLQLATGLGDRRAEADFTTRLIVLESSRLRLDTALERADTSLARARLSASQEAVPLALDGLKTVLSYLGDTVRLPQVVAELTPVLQRDQSMYLLQWAVFESSFVAVAHGRWHEARELVSDALELNRRSGFTAYGGYFRANLGWFERLAGRSETALLHGRAAVAETSPVDHPWWYATAAGLLAATLLDQGEREEAADLARSGLAAAGTDAPEAWRLRCLAPLAAALDDASGDEAYAEALALLDAASCPPGRAWVTGADCYVLVARAARHRGQHDVATRVLARLHDAVAESWDSLRQRVEDELGQISSATSRAARVAPSVGTST
ncbi:MAG: hypothetical protein JWR90_1459 [Marmoricola sp.]|nr:hypothetical protein [Marmoricola sp.]